MTLAEAVSLYIAGRVGRGEITAGTAADLKARLASLVAACGPELAHLDHRAVAGWQATVGDRRAATRRAYLSTVKVFCGWAVAEGLLEGDPTARCARVREPRQREPRNLSSVAMARLRLVLPDLRARVIVELMFSMGLRCVEVARLTARDYDPAASTMIVSGKAGEERRLPVPAAAAALLAEWQAGRPAGGPLVGLGSRRISVLVSRWMAAAGIKDGPYDGVSAHALRHTFASNTLDRCGNVYIVQAALGHASLTTTQRYLRRTTLAELRAAMAG